MLCEDPEEWEGWEGETGRRKSLHPGFRPGLNLERARVLQPVAWVPSQTPPVLAVSPWPLGPCLVKWGSRGASHYGVRSVPGPPGATLPLTVLPTAAPGHLHLDDHRHSVHVHKEPVLTQVNAWCPGHLLSVQVTSFLSNPPETPGILPPICVPILDTEPEAWVAGWAPF